MDLVCRVEGRPVVLSVGRCQVVVVELGRPGRRDCSRVPMVVLREASWSSRVGQVGLAGSSVVVVCRCDESSVIVMKMMVVSSVVVTAVVALWRCKCSICFVLVPKDRD